MGRRPLPDSGELLTKIVGVRLTAKEFSDLSILADKSDCHSVPEIIRRQVTGKKITVFERDATADPLMEELILIRSQLQGIGNNINQVTRHFNSAPVDSQRLASAKEFSEILVSSALIMEQLKSRIEQISEKWLQR